MKKLTIRSVSFATLAVTLFVAVPAVKARTANRALQVSGASIAVRCPLTVGGSFEAKTSAMTGELWVDPDKQGQIDGSIAVDLRTLETGIGLRDSHMLTQYLEVDRGGAFAAATLKDIRLSSIDPNDPVGKGTFNGVLGLHGQERPVAGTTEIRRSGEALHVKATFPVKVSDFAIPTPTYLGMGVKDEITVAVNFQTVPKF